MVDTGQSFQKEVSILKGGGKLNVSWVGSWSRKRALEGKGGKPQSL
jgi:hypothetical protein